jgi:hypothetical protein
VRDDWDYVRILAFVVAVALLFAVAVGTGKLL